MMGERETVLTELECEGGLCEPDRLRERIETLDWLDAHFLHDELADAPAAGMETEIYRRAKAVYLRLEASNCALYQAIRGEIQRGAGRDALLRFAANAGLGSGSGGLKQADGYDYLEDLLGGVLQLKEPDAGRAQLEAEMVGYQPTPARRLFDWIGRATLTEWDVVMDLGSGLGHVTLLAAICAPARSVGIDVDAGYVDGARRSAKALNLSNAMFLCQDVREADLSLGTVFYLYTPFVGGMLRAVLDLLRREAARRDIRVCTYGPCTPVIAKERWLLAAGGLEPDRIAEFRSR
jgi:SAM-dependent methyltransferase